MQRNPLVVVVIAALVAGMLYVGLHMARRAKGPAPPDVKGQQAPQFSLKSLDGKKMPITGENFRKEMLAMKSVDTPLTGKTVFSENHTVTKPVYLMEVKGGKWTRKAVVGE